MSGGKQRRSSRLPMMDERKAQQMRSTNKNKGKGLATSEDLGSGEGGVNLNKKRKHIKTKSIHDLVGDYGYEGHSSDSSEGPPFTLSDTDLPKKSKLKLLLDTLIKRDGRNIFAEPVDPDEVEGYYETIKEPMDFATMTTKLEEGRYQTLAEFERDVTLVYSNGMRFNASSTVFYRQARYLRDLARKLFAYLRADPENFERAVAEMRVRAGRREDSGVQIPKARSRDRSTNRTSSNGSEEEEIQYLYDEDQLGSYRTWGSLIERNESILSSLYKNAEQPLPMADTNLDEVGFNRNWKRFLKNSRPTAEMVAGPKLSTDSEAFNNHRATTPRQLRTQKYGTLSAPSWNIGDYNNMPEDVLRSATSSRNLSGAMNIPGGGVNGQKASAFDTLDYGEALSRGFLPVGSGVGNPGTFSPHFSAPWNSSCSDSNNFIPSAVNKGKIVQTMLTNSSNSEEIPGNYGGNLAQPVGRYNFSKENASHQFIGNYYSAPENQDDFVSGSINKIKNILMEDPTSLYPLLSNGFPERTSLSIRETPDVAVNRYLPNQGIGSSNYSTLLGPGNSYFDGAEITQGNSDKFYPGPGIMGTAGPGMNQSAQAQSTGSGDSAFNGLVPNQGFRGGYFTNLLLYGIDPLAEFEADEDAEKFIQAALIQGASSVHVPGFNLSGPRIQDPPSGPSPNSTGGDARERQAVSGYGGGASDGDKVAQAGQTSGWPQPSEWPLLQQRFYFPVQGKPSTGAGLGSQAAALLMQALGARFGPDGKTMAGPSGRNYPSNP